MTKPMIEFQDFSFKYDSQKEPTLRKVNLTIYQGEKVLIVGASGSGKSTLGQCINGVIPTIYKGTKTGTLKMNGKEGFAASIYEKSLLVSTVLQDTDGQFVGLSVAEDVAFALENDVVPLKSMKEKVDEWAKRLELQDLLQHRPQDLSGGQKQRVSLAGVLIDESPILLFDEPLANLDPKSGQDTIDLIDRLHQEEQATTIIIEHRLEDVLYRTVDRIVLVHDGRIIYNGKPADLLCSTLLTQYGIREPLYLSVLRQLGFDLKRLEPIVPIKNLDISSLQISELPPFIGKKPDNSPLLEIRNLQYAYTDKPILKGINLTMYQGERLAIVGKNGAGKSTLAKALCQFIHPSGDIFWKGQSIKEDSLKERAERIGYVLQNPNQMISQTMIFDEVALGLRLRGLTESEIKQRVEEILKVCSLYAFRNWPISALSFGQKKRLTIASILVLNPEILLLDEPTAGQDQRSYTDIMEFLNQLHEQGHTIVMITHDMQLMMDYSDRTLVVVDGEIVADASPAEILTDSALIAQANLKETSIFQLADKVGADPLELTRFYMNRKENT